MYKIYWVYPIYKGVRYFEFLFGIAANLYGQLPRKTKCSEQSLWATLNY